MEIFKEIPVFEKYQAGDLGNIKSLDYRNTGKEKILKPYKHKLGYLYVYFRKNRIKKSYSVHRLILKTFKWENKLECNHINGIKEDNRLVNLEYCTRSENLKHKYRILGYKNNFHTDHPSKKIKKSNKKTGHN